MLNTLLIDNGSIHTKSLLRLLDPHTNVLQSRELDTEDGTGYDLIVLSGNSIGPLYGNEKYFEKELTLIRETQKPLIGICFGAELLVHAFGGTLENMSEKHSGFMTLHALPENGFLDSEYSFRTYESHRWKIATLPNTFQVIATSDHGPEIIRHRERPLWGFQFHPEHLTDETSGDEIFHRILSSFRQKSST